jgi:hypothetical protein
MSTLDLRAMKNALHITRTLLILSAWLSISLPATAWAQSYAQVQKISEPDARGRWHPVKESAAAVRLEGETRTPLVVGMALSLGDHIVTDNARVTIGIGPENRIGSGRQETMTLSSGGDITLQERSVIQQLGEVYYQVRDIFTVQYGTVQTAVEGTEFRISGTEGPVQVAVTEGAVRVTNGGSSVRVGRGQQVSVSPEATPPTPTKLSGAALRSVQSSAWTLGRPRLKLGLIASGGLIGSEVGGESHTFVTVQVLPHVNLIGNLGLGFASNSSLNSSGLGLEFDIGGWSLGGSLQTTMERYTKDCGAQYRALHIGGTAHGRFTMNITRRFFLAANAQVGANGSGYTAAGGLGGGVSL